MYEEHSEIKSKLYNLLIPAYEWLYNTASDSANWEEIRATSLAAVCLSLIEDNTKSIWMPQIKRWLLSEQKSVEYVEYEDIKNNTSGDESIKMPIASWNYEIWDTSNALIALKRLNISNNNQQFINGFNFIRNLFDINNRQNWHDEPWETSWSIIAFLIADPDDKPEKEIYRAALWLKGLQDKDGRIVAPHYTAYFLLIYNRLKIHDEDLNSFKESSRKATEYLMSIFNKRTLWTGEPWSNGQILWALCESGNFPIDNFTIIQQIIEWYKDKDRWGDQGNWSDVEDTASSILGMYYLLFRLEELNLENATLIHNIIRDHLVDNIVFPELCLKIDFFERCKEGLKKNYWIINISPGMRKKFAIVFSILSGISLLIGFWDVIKPLFLRSN